MVSGKGVVEGNGEGGDGGKGGGSGTEHPLLAIACPGYIHVYSRVLNSFLFSIHYQYTCALCQLHNIYLDLIIITFSCKSKCIRVSLVLMYCTITACE